MRLTLLPKTLLVKTGEVDHADWNYRPLLGLVQRRRFRLCLKLLGPTTYRRLLVVGYGSGVFLPALRPRTDRLFGLDLHALNAEVTGRLRAVDVAAELRSGSAERPPYPDGYFDAVVAVSTLEFVEDIASAAAGLARVLTDTGTLVVVMPASSPFLDFLLRVLTGADARRDFQDRRPKVVPALLKHFTVVRRLAFPAFFGRLFPVYHAFAFKKRTPARGSGPRGPRGR